MSRRTSRRSPTRSDARSRAEPVAKTLLFAGFRSRLSEQPTRHVTVRTIVASPAPTPPTDHVFVTVREAAELLRVQPKTLLGWARAGRLTEFRFGPRSTRFDLSEVTAMIEDSASQSATDFEAAAR